MASVPPSILPRLLTRLMGVATCTGQRAELDCSGKADPDAAVREPRFHAASRHLGGLCVPKLGVHSGAAEGRQDAMHGVDRRTPDLRRSAGDVESNTEAREDVVLEGPDGNPVLAALNYMPFPIKGTAEAIVSRNRLRGEGFS
ncbi:hypothetical protein OPT61_g9254 [Boeremia exigua]|uniref:Uncharacterized protein n=1 Tax=Boeremia exigua TaxID=749465 RepID=A0ACC2HVX0_9PLEO|nr:hypothetical protein OPT61_g9254 [Boeremia exigua]